MSDPDKALQTQLANIEQRTKRTLAQLHEVLRNSGLEKHGEMVTLLKTQLHMGHGDANTVVHTFRAAATAAAPAAPAGAVDVLEAIYSGTKAPLRILHDEIIAAIGRLGAFEIAPKKAYVSLRRKKQFAMVGPGTKGRLEIGLNMRDVPATERLLAQPAGGMCQYKVFVGERSEIDKQLIGWVRTAYDGAG